MRADHAWIDEAAAFVNANAHRARAVGALLDADRLRLSAQQQLARRRAVLIEDVKSRYGIPMYVHPRRPDAVVMSESGLELLTIAVHQDELLSAIGRGYYDGLGGEVTVITAPDWACDRERVAWARLYAAAVVPWARPLVRALTRLLPPYGGNTP